MCFARLSTILSALGRGLAAARRAGLLRVVASDLFTTVDGYWVNREPNEQTEALRLVEHRELHRGPD